MATDGPRVNQSDFVVFQQNKVLAIVSVERLDESAHALAEAGVDLTQIDVLQGEIGACILDFDGTEHGLWAHVARTLQKLGTSSNERENYAAALRAGEAIIIVSVRGDVGVDACSHVLTEHGCRRIIHVGRYTTDQISY